MLVFRHPASQKTAIHAYCARLESETPLLKTRLGLRFHQKISTRILYASKITRKSSRRRPSQIRIASQVLLGPFSSRCDWISGILAFLKSDGNIILLSISCSPPCSPCRPQLGRTVVPIFDHLVGRAPVTLGLTIQCRSQPGVEALRRIPLNDSQRGTLHLLGGFYRWIQQGCPPCR